MSDRKMIKTLLVEDSKVTRKIIMKSLSPEFNILEADDRESALRLFRENDPDIVLLANTLATENCYALCAELRAMENDRGAPIILMGASASPADYEEGFRAGASGFLVKPFRKEELFEKIMLLSSRATIPQYQTVLIAEDSRSVRLILVKTLANAGFDVLEAEDGSEALALLETHEVDLLSTDCQMPHIDGLQLTIAVRKSARLSSIPILMLTSLNDSATASAAKKAGVDAFLVKPFQPDEYVKAVAGLLAERKQPASYTIYVAEDSRTDRAQLERLLQDWSFRSEIFENGRLLLDRLETVRTDRTKRPDLILLDFFMPDLDGLSVLRAIRSSETLRDLPVIMISAFNNYERIAESIAEGVNDFVIKPFVEDEVLARIRIHLRSQHADGFSSTGSLRAEKLSGRILPGDTEKLRA